jgi:hypothetical protein
VAKGHAKIHQAGYRLATSVTLCLFQGTGKGRRAMPRQQSFPKGMPSGERTYPEIASSTLGYSRLFSQEEMM